jgi:methionyl-tRNA formyltransferase
MYPDSRSRGMTRTRVALFGGQDLGYVMADYFSRRDDLDLFVVSYESRRDVINGYRSALTICRERNIRFIDSGRPAEDVEAALARWRPDIIVAAYYARLLSPELVKIPRLGAINVHPGKFPRYRGPMPTPWYILNGEKTFGIAILQIDEGIDAGPVFVEREYPIAENETGHGLLRRTMTAAAELYIENFDRIVRGELVARPQQGEPLFCPRIEPRYQIDWSSSRETIARRIRVHAKPYFPAYSFLYNRMVAINAAQRDPGPGMGDSRPGEIVGIWEDGRISVACGDGNLIVQDYEVFPPLTAQQRLLHFEVGARFA